MRKNCFGCGFTEHNIKDCPKNKNVQASGGRNPRDSLYRQGAEQRRSIGGWKKLPMKVTLGNFVKDSLNWSDGRDKEQIQGG